MIVLDTNVLSEVMRPRPDPAVEGWLAGVPASGLFITSITEAELRYGIALLPAGRRRQRLMDTLEAILIQDFAERILPFDSAAATAYATLASDRYKRGRPISQFDAQIAAIARSRGAMLATRNIDDFEACQIDLISPWQTLS
jgi:predicted nucleic acid-binding protein